MSPFFPFELFKKFITLGGREIKLRRFLTTTGSTKPQPKIVSLPGRGCTKAEISRAKEDNRKKKKS